MGGCGSPGASTLGRLLLLVVLLCPPSTLLLFLLSTRSPGLARGRSSCRGVGDCFSCCDAGGGGLRLACRNCTASSSMDDSCCRSFGSRGIRAIQLLTRNVHNHADLLEVFSHISSAFTTSSFQDLNFSTDCLVLAALAWCVGVGVGR